MKHPLWIALAVVGLTSSLVISAAEKKKTRDEQVINDRKELKDSETWIYNNLDEAKEAAKAAGKPMMIVFRCIP